MSQLIKIAGYPGAPRASVIFVHGLGGHAYDTWRRDIKKKVGDDASFWPLWLAQDVEGITVYTLAYEAPASNWLGTSMPLQDRAVNVLEILLGAPGLKTGPIVFVCHSLGGLIVKQLLLDLQQQKDRRKDAKDLLNRVTEIVFAATPHTGSRHASLLDRLRFFAWPSTIARTLAANDPALRAINVAYRGLADERRNFLQHRIFYETQGTPWGVIVDEASSDPGLPGDPPVPIDATHISIAKPLHSMSVLYARTRDFVVAGAPALEGENGALKIFPLPPIRSEQPLNLLPKLIRVAGIGIVVLIGYKGVQALIAEPPPTEHLIEQLHVKDIQIAALHKHADDLTKMLLDKNPAAGPGAQRAVGAAVQSIVQGAEAGDSRLQKALGLLKENKLAEATQLLTVFAGDKEARAEKPTAQAEKDRKEAAVAYRNLGAIAGLADPKRALDAYEKALALDPDDIMSLYWAGYILIEYGDLNKAQQRLERVLQLAESGDQPFYKFRAGNGLGDIKQKRGDLSGALTSYKDSLGIADRLAKSDPGNAGWQRDLSVSYENVGDVLVAQGHLPEALKTYQQGLAIADRLAKSDPGNAEWQRDLSVSYDRVGEVLVAQGHLPEALKTFEDSLEIRERLAQSDPGNAGWQRNLSFSYFRIGDVLVAQGNLPEALKTYQAGLAIADRLAQSDPGNAGWQRNLSVSYERIGIVLVAQGHLPAALKTFEDSLEIRERLAKSDPGNAGWQSDLAVARGMVGSVQQEQGNLPAALKAYQDGLVVFERLAKSDPGNAEWQRYLSVSYKNIGNVLVAKGNLPAALKTFEDSLEIRERLAKSDPGNAEWQSDLAASYDRIGDVQQAQGNLPAALESYEARHEIISRLAKSDPGNAEWQRDLSASFFNLANVHKQSGDKAKAREYLRQGQAIMARLTKLSPENAQWKSDLARFDSEIVKLERDTADVRPLPRRSKHK